MSALTKINMEKKYNRWVNDASSDNTAAAAADFILLILPMMVIL